jgi:hypothetical protein
MIDNKSVPQSKKKFLYLLGGCAVALLIGYSLIPEEEYPIYHPNLGATIMDKYKWSAVKRFKSLSDCNVSGNASDVSIDWEKMNDDGITTVCLFFIFEKLGNPQAVLGWMAAEGFEIHGPRKGRGGTSTMQYFGYDPLDQVTSVSGTWFLKDQPRKFSKKRKFLSFHGYAQTIGAVWFPDGRLKSADTSLIVN